MFALQVNTRVIPRVHTCASHLGTRFIVFQVNTCVFHVNTLAGCRLTHMCVPGVHVCVCVLYKKHTLVFQLNTCMRVPGECICVCVHRCTSARAAYTVSVVYLCVFHMYTHTCVSELDMCVARGHTCVHARAFARYRTRLPQFLRGAEA